MINFLKRLGGILKILGLDIKAIFAIRFLPKYISDIFRFRRMGGKINSYFPILRDFHDNDDGDLETDMDVDEAMGKYNYGFGIYTFVKL